MLFQPFLANFNMMGIKKHVLQLRNLFGIPLCNVISQNWTHFYKYSVPFLAVPNFPVPFLLVSYLPVPFLRPYNT